MPDMWLQRTRPDVLIYLDVSREALLARRPNRDSLANRLPVQRERLAHAREHCDLYVDTSKVTADDVLEQVVTFLAQF